MRVDRVETHFSWLFLTGTHVYKLKKPVHDDVVDLRTVESRRRNCLTEMRVNRRFAAGVYEAVLALVADDEGRYRLAAAGRACDWVLRMRRLPAHRALDRIIARGELDTAALAPVVALLWRVYGRRALPVTAETHRARLGSIIDENARELLRPSFGLPRGSIESICGAQRSLLDAYALGARAQHHRIVEGHGDLRPEHVFLTDPPCVIDALEFSRALRIADTADELGYLALECERLGVPEGAGGPLRRVRTAHGRRPAALGRALLPEPAGVRTSAACDQAPPRPRGMQP